ncbi:tRNA lysidine(34) synthetase TilS, partial [Nostoc sp. NIES-2111]
MHHLALHLPPAPADAVWLLACSGGQDSVVLAHLAHRQGLPFALAHVNYRLRGPESDMDEIFVRELAAQLGVAFHVSHPVIDKQAGVQEQARHARYAFFAQLLQEHGYAGILTAHHAQDQAETILLNLLRGTGLRGLRGMLAYSPERKLGRPLLHVPKTDIEAFAKAQNLRWREDGSNAGDAYTRNRLRHHLLPILHQLHPGWEANLLSTATQATEAWQALTASSQTAPLEAGAYPSQFSIFNFQFENRFARAGRIQAAYPGLPFTLALRLADAVDSPTHPDRKLETALGTFELREDTLYFTPTAAPAEGSR